MRVPENQAVVIERRGQFRAVVTNGSASILPLLDKVRARIDLREQLMTLKNGPTVYFQVIDPRAAVYNTPSYISALEQAARTALQNTSDLRQLQWELEQEAARWGVQINRVAPAAEDHA